LSPSSRRAEDRTTKTVLFICHNHPAVRPGGAEAYALELHRHLRASGDFESVFLAKGGPPLSTAGRPHLGTYVAPVTGGSNEYFLYTDGYDYDWTFGTIRHDKELYTKHLRGFLKAIRPDVVHLHHTMFFGYDTLREIRNTLPHAPIVYTLHEYMPICHRQGQMLRTTNDEPCLEESPRRCHECFPEISPQTFFMRKRFVQSHFSLVDLFIAPSAFLAERYVDWGIPRERIRVEEYGRTPPEGTLVEEPREYRDRFGFFGQLTPFKGPQVLAEAMALLAEDDRRPDDALLAALELAAGVASHATVIDGPEPHAWIHGANLDLQPGAFQNRIAELLGQARSHLTFVGRYRHDELPSLMGNVDWVVVPSVWWENSPLVIQEAFHFKRPVICSDIGGMAEKVAHGVNGLHFRTGDARSLAETIRTAVSTPSLWERLRQGIEPVYAMSDHVDTLGEIYSTLLQRTKEVTYA
jgi:glycosyltransferase involved in cell wall biosynthesis